MSVDEIVALLNLIPDPVARWQAMRDLPSALSRVRAGCVEQAVAECGSVKGAAEALGVTRSTAYLVLGAAGLPGAGGGPVDGLPEVAYGAWLGTMRAAAEGASVEARLMFGDVFRRRWDAPGEMRAGVGQVPWSWADHARLLDALDEAEAGVPWGALPGRLDAARGARAVTAMHRASRRLTDAPAGA